MKNNFESIEDMQRMQQEAVRRVREMQKRAKQSLMAGTKYSASNEANNLEVKSQKEPGIIEQSENLELVQNADNKVNNTSSKQVLNKSNNNFNFFSVLLKDREKTLILLLILLLVDEGCDMSLVVALMYLII